MKVGIIGAGAAGLAAAYDLANAGHQVVVYEAAPFVGGQASTIEVGGGRLERGYHHLFTNDAAILDLIDELGLTHTMRWIPSRVGTYAGGRVYDFVTALDLLRFKPLPLRDRIKLGLVTLRLRYMKDWRKLERETADAWIMKHAGRRIYDVVWGPLLRGKFGAYHDRIGLPWFWGKIQTRFASRNGPFGRELLGYPVNSFDEIFDTLEQRIESRGGRVLLNTPVQRIAVTDGRARGLVVRTPEGAAAEEPVDAVLATAPSFAFTKLVDLPDAYRRRVESVAYLGAVVLILEMTRRLTHIYWMNIADDSIPFVGAIEHTNLMPTELYGGRHVLYLTNYLDRRDALYSLSADELLDLYVPHLSKFNPDFDRSWIRRVHYNRLSAAQPVIEPGYSERIPAHRTPIAGLYLANTTQIYPEDRGTNYSVRMGREVAKMMMADLA